MLNSTLKVLACILFVVLIIGGGNFFWNARIFMQQGQGTMHNLNRATGTAADYGESLKEQAEENKKSIDAALQVGATAKGSLQLLNRTTIPLLNRNLTSSDSLIRSLEQNTASLNTMIANLDNRVSGDKGLLPTTTATIDSIRVLTERELSAAVAEFTLAGKNVRIITESPELQNLPKDIAALTQSLNRSAGSIEVILESTEATSANTAAITGNLKAISDDSAKSVHNLLNPPPAPWYRKYILTPLREVGGVTYLLVKIANGL
jgi:hypothetical protein